MTLIPSGTFTEPVYVTPAAALTRPLGATTISNMSTAKGLADGSPAGIPSGARIAQVSWEGGGTIRYQRKGTPTSTAGTVLPTGTTVFEGSLDTLRFLETVAGSNVLQVKFFA